MRAPGALIVAVAFILLATPAHAGEEGRLQNAFRAADGPEERVKVVLEIAKLDSRRAASMLKKIASEDRSAFVRETAVDGLGTCGSDRALDHLLELLAEGGPEVLREAVARAVARKDGGPKRLLDGARDKDIESHRRCVAIAALGCLSDPATLHGLYTLSQSDDYVVRTEALRALGRRADAVEDLAAALASIYRSRLDAATRLLVLDLIEARPDPTLLTTLKAPPRPRHPLVKEALRHAIATLEREQFLIRQRAAAENGYGTPDPPNMPEPRPRFDLVFTFDATGSMSGMAGRVRRVIDSRVKELGAETADIRVGVVIFRQTQKGVSWKYPEVLPLTHDLDRVREFLDGFKQGFPADSQGAAIYHGLHLGLDRMVFRNGATREFLLFSDTGCHDFSLCRRVVIRHADEVRIRFAWCGRRSPPADIRNLASLAGEAIVR
jgi:HEAT repeats